MSVSLFFSSLQKDRKQPCKVKIEVWMKQHHLADGRCLSLVSGGDGVLPCLDWSIPCPLPSNIIYLVIISQPNIGRKQLTLSVAAFHMIHWEDFNEQSEHVLQNRKSVNLMQAGLYHCWSLRIIHFILTADWSAAWALRRQPASLLLLIPTCVK